MIGKRVVSIIFMALLLAVAGRGGNPLAGEDTNRGKTDLPLSDRGMESANAQWCADPERGWIRVDERPQSQKKAPARPPQNRIENSGGKATIGYRDY